MGWLGGQVFETSQLWKCYILYGFNKEAEFSDLFAWWELIKILKYTSVWLAVDVTNILYNSWEHDQNILVTNCDVMFVFNF